MAQLLETESDTLKSQVLPVFVHTYGCQMNEYDTTRLMDALKNTFTIDVVSSPYLATLLIMNTCSVREKAVDKMFSELGIWSKIKAKNKNLIIAVGGCVASQEGTYVFRRAPYVDIVFGPQSLHLLPTLVTKAVQGKRHQTAISFLAEEKFDQLPDHVVETAEHNKKHSFVSIMEGCGKFCSYCIVPHTRGSEFYRAVDSIVHEVNSLVSQGITSVTLLGQNVNAWKGFWKGRRVDFAWLLHVIDAIKGVSELRFTTSHPLEMTKRLITCYSTTRSLVAELHLPVQSGSDRILKKMKRGYTAAQYISIIQELRKISPNIILTTDFIVGFPGETDEDFQSTVSLIKECDFVRAYCYMYSKRPFTSAQHMDNQVPLAQAQNRLKHLQDMFISRKKIVQKNNYQPILFT
ncbi:MAG: tRNA (N6-isopentenyl adenosine(37)-C2)-methylthiotransferase MiaB [Methylacidiphilales bacterium]|nr:tRNA (N6-isopentenyl adenosine(37)-C2)-methylthiotransferase MiaB [Candidatus Methylacidiphilales bacterium]